MLLVTWHPSSLSSASLASLDLLPYWCWWVYFESRTEIVLYFLQIWDTKKGKFIFPFFVYMSRWQDSNQWPADYKSAALPNWATTATRLHSFVTYFLESFGCTFSVFISSSLNLSKYFVSNNLVWALFNSSFPAILIKK